MKLTAGQVSDYKGAALLMDAINALPETRALLADHGKVVIQPTNEEWIAARHAVQLLLGKEQQ